MKYDNKYIRLVFIVIIWFLVLLLFSSNFTAKYLGEFYVIVLPVILLLLVVLFHFYKNIFAKNNKSYVTIKGAVQNKKSLPVGCEFNVDKKIFALLNIPSEGLSDGDSIEVIGKYFNKKVTVYAMNNYTKKYQSKQRPTIRLLLLIIASALVLYLYHKFDILENIPSNLDVVFYLIIAFFVLPSIILYSFHLLKLQNINKSIDKLWGEND